MPAGMAPGPALFILTGQSNSWGIARFADLDQSNWAQWSRYNSNDFASFNFANFEYLFWQGAAPYAIINSWLKQMAQSSRRSAEETFSGQHQYSDGNNFGAEIGIAGQAMKVGLSLSPVIFKQAYPGNSISNFLLNYKQAGQSLNNGGNYLTSIFSNLQTAYPEKNYSSVFFIWHQGESDSTPSWSDDYYSNLTSLLSISSQNLAARYPYSIRWKIIVSISNQIPPPEDSLPAENWNQVRNAQDKAAINAADLFTVILHTDSLPLDADNVHLPANSQLALGECLVNLQQTLLTQFSAGISDLTKRRYICKLALDSNNQYYGQLQLMTPFIDYSNWSTSTSNSLPNGRGTWSSIITGAPPNAQVFYANITPTVTPQAPLGMTDSNGQFKWGGTIGCATGQSCINQYRIAIPGWGSRILEADASP